MRRLLLLSAVFLLPASAVAQPSSSSAPPPSAAADAFAKLKTLHGDWIDVDGTFGEQGKVAVTYRVTGGGNAVVETFPAGTANEMVTVYHVDGRKLVLTHYCTSNTQPRMTSNGLQGTTLAFEYAGGDNIDPATTSHMHSTKIEFISADELKATWVNWSNGKSDHAATFRVVRKKP
jgi:hypothetical protein